MTTTPPYNERTPNNFTVPAYLNWLFQKAGKPYLAFFIDHPLVTCSRGSIHKCSGIHKSVDTNGKQRDFMTLNISAQAAGKFTMGGLGVTVMVRMGGQPMEFYVPYDAVWRAYDEWDHTVASQFEPDLPVIDGTLEDTPQIVASYQGVPDPVPQTDPDAPKPDNVVQLRRPAK